MISINDSIPFVNHQHIFHINFYFFITIYSTFYCGGLSSVLVGSQFKLSSTGKLDYETLSRYNVTFRVSDGKSTTGPYSLTINVQNVNEECYFDRQAYYISVVEGTVSHNQFTINMFDASFFYNGKTIHLIN